MRYTIRFVYAIKAMLSLLSSTARQPMSIQTIKRRFSIPENYLAHILTDLRKAGLVKSLRGTGGGYFIMRSPNEISLKDIVLAVEGDRFIFQKKIESNHPNIDTVLEKIFSDSIQNSLNVFENISVLDLHYRVDQRNFIDFVI